MSDLKSGIKLCTVLSALTLVPAAASAQSVQISLPDPLPLVNTITVGDITGPGYPGGGGPTSQNLPQYQAGAGTRFDGVARLLIGGSGCTGSLIKRNFILTAAHCVSNGSIVSAASSITASFLQDMGGGVTQRVDYSANGVYVMPGYSGAVVENQDIALIRLSTNAASWIPTYSLFHGNPMHTKMTFAGFGRSGNGVTGGVVLNLFDPIPIRRKADNRFDSNMIENTSTLTVNLGGTPVNNILVSDFDGSSPAVTVPGRGTYAARTVAQNNTLCNAWTPSAGVLGPTLLAKICDTGYGTMEGEIGSGDSGGPAFVETSYGALRLAAVASFGSQRCVVSPTFATSPGCPSGSILNGAYFGSYNGHVAVGYGTNNDFIMATTTPEPTTMILLGTGLASIAGARRRKRAAATAAAESAV